MYAIGSEYRKNGDSWQIFIGNSVDFVCRIRNFPLELKKSYVDQLCELDGVIMQHLYSESRNQNLSRLMQELDYLQS